MSFLSKNWFVIVNPTSGNGLGKRKWPEIRKSLLNHKFNFECAFTTHRGHSVDLTLAAIEKGFLNFICVGGDGTLHNIANGIMRQNTVTSRHINVGVIPIGTGNDWVKTHHIPTTIEQAIQVLKLSKLKCQDVGKLVLHQSPNIPVYFINLAGIGFDAYVVSKVETFKEFGAFAYYLGALMGMFSYKNFHIEVSINDDKVSTKSLMVLIGLCNYSGGGMQLTKAPNPFDGLLDISIAKDFNGLDLIKNTANLFNGAIVNYKKVDTYTTRHMTLKIKDILKPFIQADGELVGQGDFSVSIIPKSFSFYSG